MLINRYPLRFYRTSSFGGIRVFGFGFGFGWKDTTRHPLTFSERNGYKSRMIVGKWAVVWLNR